MVHEGSRTSLLDEISNRFKVAIKEFPLPPELRYRHDVTAYFFDVVFTGRSLTGTGRVV
jgi:hypothetical protein